MAADSPSSSGSFLTSVLAIGWFFIIPLYWGVNTLTSFFNPTSGERARRDQLPCYERPFLLTLAVPALTIFILLTIPLALIGLCFWIPSRLCKPEYFVAISPDVKTRTINLNFLSQEQFGIVTCNVRLLPEAAARRNNLADTQKRSHDIGSSLALSRLPSESSSGCSCDIERHTCVHLSTIPRSCQSTILPSASSSYEIWPSLALKHEHYQNGVDKSENYKQSDVTKSDCVVTIQNGSHVDLDNGHSSSIAEVSVAINPDVMIEIEQTSNSQNGIFPANSPLHNGAQSNTDQHKHLDKQIDKQIVDKQIDKQIHQHVDKTHQSDHKLHIHPDSHPHAGISADVNRSDNNVTNRVENLVDKHSLRNSTSSHKSRDSSCYLSFHEDVFEYFLSDVLPSDSDFLCLQDISDPSAMKTVVSHLQSFYPYVLYDVGKPSILSDLFLGNSGLILASHFPIECAEFRSFTDSFHRVRCVSRGILMVKVRLKQQHEGHTRGIMGYISIASLEPNTAANQIRKSQLNEIQSWQTEFRNQTAAGTHDLVAFDILCGDFNFDNESPRDEECWSHSLMTHYQDPCRICQGRDKPWTIGTRLVQSQLHHPDVQNAISLKQTLSDFTRRGEFIESIQLKPAQTDVQTACNGKCRTDYILYNLETSNTNMCVDEYHFCTQMATLTDHLTVAMRFHLDERK